ncbi:MAG TPA: LLM class flavin-dependent oxidoreductase [Anaerolineae bacterium]|nr:LLM class flavin-dependent oxidoreductase [Anaerolineae bacterium]
MQISLMIEGQSGLNWQLWKEIGPRAEDWGFAGLYTSDHFVPPMPPNYDALEMVVAHTYLAANTQRVHFGPLVSPMTFRDPVILARQAGALDDLSGGRMILGVGAGWMEREHNMFGYALPPKPIRMERFAEGLAVIDLLLRGKQPANFQGKYFHLRDAEIRPRTGKTRILVGGNGINRTLRLAAQYADVWNGVQLGPARFRELANQLDTYMREAGRDPQSIKKTVATFFYYGATPADLERRFAYIRSWSAANAAMSLDELTTWLRDERHAVVGNQTQVIEQIHAYAKAGVQELVLQWFTPQDQDDLKKFATDILPKL